MKQGDIIGGRYEIQEMIGKGGHGKVFRALDRQLSQMVALKVLRGDVAQERTFKLRMAREAKSMGQLAGTCAVQIMAFNKTKAGSLYLVMEYLKGKDLRAYLDHVEKRGRPLPIHELYEILEPIAETLELAHNQNIVHRDIKPANVFVLDSRARGRARLLDFGLAKDLSVEGFTKPGMIGGSPAYIAPEMWLAKRPIDRRCDVYGLGVLLFRVLAGKVPFDHKRPMDQLVRDVTRAERPSLHALRPDLHPTIDEWVVRALAVKRDERFETVESMWNFLDIVLKQ